MGANSNWSSRSDPALDATSVTPADTDLADGVTRGIYVGVGGNLFVKMRGGTIVEFRNVPDGTLLPISVIQVRTTGPTTASQILALY